MKPFTLLFIALFCFLTLLVISAQAAEDAWKFEASNQPLAQILPAQPAINSVVNALPAVVGRDLTLQASNLVSDKRMQALAVGSAALKANNAYNSYQGMQVKDASNAASAQKANPATVAAVASP